MKAIALFIAALMVLLGLTGVLWPEGLTQLATYSFSRTGLYVVAAGRLILGGLLFFAATATRTPKTVRVIGLVIFIAGIQTAVISPERADLMKKAGSSNAARAAAATLFFLAALFITSLALFLPRLQSANPASGSMGLASASLAWDGTAPGTGAANGESSCTEGVNCDTFTLTVTGTPADWANAAKRIEVKIIPPAATDDYDLIIHKGSNAGATVDSSGHGTGRTEL